MLKSYETASETSICLRFPFGEIYGMCMQALADEKLYDFGDICGDSLSLASVWEY